MKDILRRLHLITSFEIELPLEKEEIVHRLQTHIAPPDINPFGRLGRIFNPSVAPYIGVIQADSFRLRPRISVSGFEGPFAFIGIPTFEGQFISLESGTILVIEVDGVSFTQLLPVVGSLSFTCFVLTGFIYSVFSGKWIGLEATLFILTALVLIIYFFVRYPYIKARRNMQDAIQNLKHDIFHFTQRPK